MKTIPLLAFSLLSLGLLSFQVDLNEISNLSAVSTGSWYQIGGTSNTAGTGVKVGDTKTGPAGVNSAKVGDTKTGPTGVNSAKVGDTKTGSTSGVSAKTGTSDVGLKTVGSTVYSNCPTTWVKDGQVVCDKKTYTLDEIKAITGKTNLTQISGTGPNTVSSEKTGTSDVGLKTVGSTVYSNCPTTWVKDGQVVCDKKTYTLDEIKAITGKTNLYQVDGTILNTQTSARIGNAIQTTLNSAPKSGLGCTVPKADNYNPNALMDDGSCRGCLDRNNKEKYVGDIYVSKIRTTNNTCKPSPFIPDYSSKSCVTGIFGPEEEIVWLIRPQSQNDSNYDYLTPISSSTSTKPTLNIKTASSSSPANPFNDSSSPEDEPINEYYEYELSGDKVIVPSSFLSQSEVEIMQKYGGSLYDLQTKSLVQYDRENQDPYKCKQSCHNTMAMNYNPEGAHFGNTCKFEFQDECLDPKASNVYTGTKPKAGEGKPLVRDDPTVCEYEEEPEEEQPNTTPRNCQSYVSRNVIEIIYNPDDEPTHKSCGGFGGGAYSIVSLGGGIRQVECNLVKEICSDSAVPNNTTKPKIPSKTNNENNNLCSESTANPYQPKRDGESRTFVSGGECNLVPTPSARSFNAAPQNNNPPRNNTPQNNTPQPTNKPSTEEKNNFLEEWLKRVREEAKKLIPTFDKDENSTETQEQENDVPEIEKTPEEKLADLEKELERQRQMEEEKAQGEEEAIRQKKDEEFRNKVDEILNDEKLSDTKKRQELEDLGLNKEKSKQYLEDYEESKKENPGKERPNDRQKPPADPDFAKGVNEKVPTPPVSPIKPPFQLPNFVNSPVVGGAVTGKPTSQIPANDKPVEFPWQQKDKPAGTPPSSLAAEEKFDAIDPNSTARFPVVWTGMTEKEIEEKGFVKYQPAGDKGDSGSVGTEGSEGVSDKPLVTQGVTNRDKYFTGEEITVGDDPKNPEQQKFSVNTDGTNYSSDTKRPGTASKVDSSLPQVTIPYQKDSKEYGYDNYKNQFGPDDMGRLVKTTVTYPDGTTIEKLTVIGDTGGHHKQDEEGNVVKNEKGNPVRTSGEHNPAFYDMLNDSVDKTENQIKFSGYGITVPDGIIVTHQPLNLKIDINSDISDVEQYEKIEQELIEQGVLTEDTYTTYSSENTEEYQKNNPPTLISDIREKFDSFGAQNPVTGSFHGDKSPTRGATSKPAVTQSNSPDSVDGNDSGNYTPNLGTETLKRGSKGEEVKELQKFLGFKEEDADGNFGPLTEKAVKDWQAKNGLDNDGVVGKDTRDKILGNSPAKTTSASNVSAVNKDDEDHDPRRVYLPTTEEPAGQPNIFPGLFPGTTEQESVVGGVVADFYNKYVAPGVLQKLVDQVFGPKYPEIDFAPESEKSSESERVDSNENPELNDEVSKANQAINDGYRDDQKELFANLYGVDKDNITDSMLDAFIKMNEDAKTPKAPFSQAGNQKMSDEAAKEMQEILNSASKDADKDTDTRTKSEKSDYTTTRGAPVTLPGETKAKLIASGLVGDFLESTFNTLGKLLKFSDPNTIFPEDIVTGPTGKSENDRADLENTLANIDEMSRLTEEKAAELTRSIEALGIFENPTFALPYVYERSQQVPAEQASNEALKLDTYVNELIKDGVDPDTLSNFRAELLKNENPDVTISDIAEKFDLPNRDLLKDGQEPKPNQPQQIPDIDDRFTTTDVPTGPVSENDDKELVTQSTQRIQFPINPNPIIDAIWPNLNSNFPIIPATLKLNLSPENYDADTNFEPSFNPSAFSPGDVQIDEEYPSLNPRGLSPQNPSLTPPESDYDRPVFSSPAVKDSDTIPTTRATPATPVAQPVPWEDLSDEDKSNPEIQDRYKELFPDAKYNIEGSQGKDNITPTVPKGSETLFNLSKYLESVGIEF